MAESVTKKAWFWLMILGVIFIIIAIIAYVVSRPVATWVWFILILGIILFFVSLFLLMLTDERGKKIAKVLTPEDGEQTLEVGKTYRIGGNDFTVNKTPTGFGLNEVVRQTTVTTTVPST